MSGNLSNSFTQPAADRLNDYCARYFSGASCALTKLVGDASSRQYFRIAKGPETYIAAVYPEPFEAATNSYCDVTDLYEAAGLPVPRILDVVGETGIILQEDLGDARLQDWLATAGDDDIKQVYRRSVELIIEIQQATKLAFAKNSIAGRLAFDEARLFWELNFFYKHFTMVFPQNLSAADEPQVLADLKTIAKELAERPRLLTHRDYHSRNLMLGASQEIFIIDHQDARMGPFSYDLASLLHDPYVNLGEALIAELYDYYLTGLRDAAAAGKLDAVQPNDDGSNSPELRKLTAEAINAADFQREFDLMTLQRMLKAVGTYTYQKGVYENDVYLGYIEPALTVARRAATALDRFPALQKFIN